MIGIKEPVSIKGPVSIEEQVYGKILSSRKKKRRQTSPNLFEIIIASVICLFILLFAYGAAYYWNVFIILGSDCSANLAQIDVQNQRRKNVGILLRKTVVEYAKHEREILTHLGELRAMVSGGDNSKSLMDGIRSRVEGNEALIALLSKDTGKWENTLSGLMAIAEQYPDLKLSENYRVLMESIIATEGKMAELRMTYNNSVNDYTNVRDMFPGFIYAIIFNIPDYDYLKLDEDARKFIPIE